MKKIALTLVFLLPVFAAAADDCAKNSDACAAGSRKLSPFMQAVSAAENGAARAAAAPELKQGRAPRKASMRQAAVSTAPAAVEISSAAPAGPAEGGRRSSPLWLLVVAGGLAGLYFYLGGGRRRGRRK